MVSMLLRSRVAGATLAARLRFQPNALVNGTSESLLANSVLPFGQTRARAESESVPTPVRPDESRDRERSRISRIVESPV